MDEGFAAARPAGASRVWQVGALVRAIADTLQARFNPLAVQGEISGFSRAASGHCYFSLKDAQGQIRCAMFRRAAQLADFSPGDGDLVEIQGRLDVYGPRGDLQFIVEGIRRAGQGALFERFLRLKAQLESEGCFDPARKRALPVLPQSVGVVTSLGAAALRDVATALARRVPHLPVTLYPASVQGAQAPAELCAALDQAYAHFRAQGHPQVLLLVRGGGSLEDLWAFNDPQLVRKLTEAPMPVVCGVGHETDFTLCDFAADLRAPTPTAAAELCAPARVDQLAGLQRLNERLGAAAFARLDQQGQGLDRLAQRLGRPAARVSQDQRQLQALAARISRNAHLAVERERHRQQRLAERLPQVLARQRQGADERLRRATQALALLDPSLVLQRGYAWLADGNGRPLVRAAQAQEGQDLRAVLADGELGLRVTQKPPSH